MSRMSLLMRSCLLAAALSAPAWSQNGEPASAERKDSGAATPPAVSTALAAPPPPAERPAPRQPTAWSLPGITLPTLGGAPGVLNSCPTPKCLVVVLAPWCTHCHNAAANIRALRDYLNTRGDATRIVIGKGPMDSVQGFAQDFGNDTVLDPAGVVPARGVPYFYTIYDQGGVVSEQVGAPEGPADVAQWAAQMSLP